MIAELGHFALILAFCTALAMTVLPIWGSLRGNVDMMLSAPPLAYAMLVLTAVSFACLATAFLQDDFSVALVANHSNSLLPSIYKFSAVWGNHEGSLLLWVLILAVWTAAVAQFSSQLPLVMLARVIGVLGFVAAGFYAFSLFTSNPFERLLPGSPADGGDLNPLLQDPGLIIHPPLLYVGYVGFSVAFAFAIAALMGGRLDAAWARWSRPWTNVAWAFLTLGIMLGSWWAYYELGWGGWWFWDPVENASFLPWLSGAALVHSLAVTEKRGLFKSWTVLLAIFTFSLSLLGTFLVRSGVLTSVHAFAADPERGVFILVFLLLVVGGSLTLYALRAPSVKSRIGFSLVSRESLLLVNNVIFLVATLTVLFGTLFPLFMDALDLGKYSVGPPYFNAVFLPLMAVLIPFMGIGPLSRWREDSTRRWRAELLAPALAALALAVILPFFHGEGFNIWVALAVLLSSWLLLGLARDFWNKLQRFGPLSFALRKLTPSYWGMVVAHAGFAVTVLGVVLTTQYSIERDLKMSPGETQRLGHYEFRMLELGSVEGPNFVADEARFAVSRDGRPVARLAPQKRRYYVQNSIMTEAAIHGTLLRDIYIALGEPIGEEAWAVRLHYKPFVRWIWLGAILIAAGGLTTVADSRYRRMRASDNAPALAGAAAHG